MGFKDLRDWLAKLESEGELKRIKAEVDWNIELGTLTYMARHKGCSGMLFENIKGYQNARCRKVFTGGLVNNRQLAMMFGLPTDAHHRAMVSTFRERLKNRIKPVTVKTGPVKENIIKGKDINLYDLPVPLWNKLDGGRYINSFAGIVTRDLENKIMNVGMYRGMITGKNRVPMIIGPSQHIGFHFAKYKAAGKEMPIAAVYGWDPSLAFTSCAAIPRDICEYDVMGSIRQQPVELVKCETSDLEVPASAEIVIEGFVSPDPDTYEPEGPFAEFTGYYAWKKENRPVFRAECITFRNDPIFVGTLAYSLPGQSGEGARMMSVNWAAMVWEVVEKTGIPGLLDVRFMPPSCETTVVMRIHKTYRTQGKHIAMAVLGSNLPFQSCKNIIVVDDDIDIYNDEAIHWAIDYRVNAMENQVVVLPDMPGSDLDPSIRGEDKGMEKFGGAIAHRTIIDATKNWNFGRREEWNNDVYPPMTGPGEEEKALVLKRWKEYGLD